MMYIVLYNEKYEGSRPYAEMSNEELFDVFAPLAETYLRPKEMRDLKKELKIAHIYKKGGTYEKK